MMRSFMAGAGALAAAAAITASAQEKPSPEQQIRNVTLVGCVELEKDDRARIGAGRGGVLGTGAGVGNEFVLTNATLATATATNAPVASTGSGRAAAGASTATSPVADKAVASTGAKPPAGASAGPAGLAGDYSLSGKLEAEFVRQVGRMVEVIGSVEVIDSHDSANDAKELPELTVQTWHTRQDFCPPGSVTGAAGGRQTGPPANAQPNSSGGSAPTPQSDPN